MPRVDNDTHLIVFDFDQTLAIRHTYKDNRAQNQDQLDPRNQVSYISGMNNARINANLAMLNLLNLGTVKK